MSWGIEGGLSPILRFRRTVGRSGPCQTSRGGTGVVCSVPWWSPGDVSATGNGPYGKGCRPVPPEGVKQVWRDE